MPQETVTKRKAGVDERSPRLSSDDPIGRQAAALLKGADRVFGRGTEHAIDEEIIAVKPLEATLDVAHALPAGAATQRCPPAGFVVKRHAAGV